MEGPERTTDVKMINRPLQIHMLKCKTSNGVAGIDYTVASDESTFHNQ